jgi:hypothetical protein
MRKAHCWRCWAIRQFIVLRDYATWWSGQCTICGTICRFNKFGGR